jgi:hypothetical protein
MRTIRLESQNSSSWDSLGTQIKKRFSLGYSWDIPGHYNWDLLVISAISCDPHLHTPMYFFLANLSSVDICFSSVTVPKMLVNHIVGSESISYMECVTQIYFFITFINMDRFLLVSWPMTAI